MPNVTPLHAEDPDRVGRHRLTGRISGMPGSGPFYLATAPDGTEVALRLLRGTWTRDAAARDRFAAEAAAARRVPPFCAARILDAGVEDGYAYLVSEYVAGKSLLETVSDDGRLRGPELEALAIGSVTGLASVHQAGLVHGGFGPEHVIMSADGPKIIEFGITPPYGSATPSADMLAWAQTMVFAAMGRPPATLADLEILPGLLRQAVGDCLAGDPALRPAARSVVLDLLDDIEPPAGALAEGSRRAAESTYAARAARSDAESRQARGGRPGPRSHSARRPGRRSGILPMAAAVVVVIAIAVVVVLVMRNAGTPSGSARGGDSATAPPTSSTSPVSSTVSAAPSPTSVAAAFAGSWTGQARQTNPSDVFHIRLSLHARSSSGSIAYSSASFSCAGDLNLQTASRDIIRLSQGIVTGQHACANGVVTLTMGDNGTLKFSFRGKAGPAASGTLTKS